MSFNKMIVVGNLGKDPDLRYTPQGTPVTTFSLATNERETIKGEKQDVTTWFEVTLFGRQAEIASQYLVKGKSVYVEGRFRSETWEDREGRTRVTNRIKATEMQLIDRVNGTSAPAGGAARQATASSESESAGASDADDDFDIGF